MPANLITQIQLPDGNVYDLADAEARAALINKLEKVVVAVLPPKTSIDPTTMNNKIYLVPRNGDVTAPDIYDAYVIALESGSGYDDPNATYMWVSIGSTGIDLAGYSMTGHVHKVTPQTKVADHNFHVEGTLPELEFEGTASSVSGSVTLNSGDVTINIGNSAAEGTSYTPGVTLGGTTESESSHTHSVKKNRRYLERTEIIGVGDQTDRIDVVGHVNHYNDQTYTGVLNLTNNATTHSHTIPGFTSASLTGSLQTGSNIATDGMLEDVSSGNGANAVFHSANVNNGVLSFGLKQLKKNVSAVTGIGTLSTDAQKTTTSGQDQFTVYHTSDVSAVEITDWDLENKTLYIPQVQKAIKVATGQLTDSSTYGGTANAQIVADVLGGTANAPQTGTTSSVNTDGGTAHTHGLNSGSNGNATATGATVKFSGSLDSGSGTIDTATVTPSGTVSYVDGDTFVSDDVTLSHTVYNPTVFTSPDTNDTNNSNSWYGITYNENDADPDKSFGRIGNMSLHASLPVQSKMVRCLLNNDGTVNYYLDPTDSTKKYNGTYNGVTSDGSNADLTGADGHVMVEIPEHWYYVTKDSDLQVTAMLSPVEQTGWVHMPKYYVSAYESCGTSSRMTSVSGVDPLQLQSLSSMRSSARANGASSDSKWNAYPYFVHTDLFWLYVIEYANTNSQAPVNNELLEGKYRQGGLGIGCTMLTLENGDPANLTGATNSLGNASGEVTVSNNGTDVKICSYRGLENFFGHISKIADGILSIYMQEDPAEVQVYVSTNPSDFSQSTTNYSNIGNKSYISGYIKILLIGNDGRGWPISINSGSSDTSSSTFYCDRNYYNYTSSGNKMVQIGGDCNRSYARVSGYYAGIAAFLDCFSTSSTSLGAATSRLVYYDKSLE